MSADFQKALAVDALAMALCDAETVFYGRDRAGWRQVSAVDQDRYRELARWALTAVARPRAASDDYFTPFVQTTRAHAATVIGSISPEEPYGRTEDHHE